VCNSQPKICNSANFFSPTYTRCPYNVPLGRQQHRVCVCVCYTSVATLVVPGLCSFCPPHCQASARRANRNAHWFFARFLTVQNSLFRTLSTHNNNRQHARRLVGTAPALTDTPEAHHGDLSMFHGHICGIGRSPRRPRPHIRRSDGGRTQSDTTERASRTTQ